jgi:hypothetical protein
VLLLAIPLAIGLAGVGVVAASATPGGEPTHLTGYGVNGGYVLTWEPPADTTDLLGYTAYINRSDDPFALPAVDTRSLAPSARSVVFPLAASTTQYVGSIVAVYTSADSAQVAARPDHPRAPIGKVRSVKVKAGDHKLSLSWSAPVTSALTGPVESYLLDLEPRGGLIAVLGSRRSISLGGLTNGTMYSVSVRAVTTDYGAASLVHGRPYVKPARPTKLTRKWVKGGKAKLHWTAPRSTLGAPVTGYYVYVNGGRVKTLSGRGTTSVTLTREKKGHKYSFSVRARNGVGSSATAHVNKKKRPIK